MKTLKQIKSENPTYDNIPDLVLADKLYEKYESKVDKETFFKGLFPEVERPDIENINMTAKFFDEHVKMRMNAMESFDNYAHVMTEFYSKMLSQFNKSTKSSD